MTVIGITRQLDCTPVWLTKNAATQNVHYLRTKHCFSKKNRQFRGRK
jgi:hypothetical protein